MCRFYSKSHIYVDKIDEVILDGINASVHRLFASCTKRRDGTHLVVHSEGDELQQGVAAGEGLSAFRQHGVLRERNPVVQGVCNKDGQRTSFRLEQGVVCGVAESEWRYCQNM